MIRLAWFTGASIVETFRENVSIRLGEISDRRELNGERLVDVLGAKVTNPQPVITAAVHR